MNEIQTLMEELSAVIERFGLLFVFLIATIGFLSFAILCILWVLDTRRRNEARALLEKINQMRDGDELEEPAQFIDGNPYYWIEWERWSDDGMTRLEPIKVLANCLDDDGTHMVMTKSGQFVRPNPPAKWGERERSEFLLDLAERELIRKRQGWDLPAIDVESETVS